MIRKSVGVLIPLTWLLASCASAAAPSTVQTQPTQAPTADNPATQAPSAAGKTYTFDPGRSTATFIIHEVLLGKPNKVVGTSQDIQGAFVLDLSDPASAEYQPVVINAELFVTDEDRRNQAIRVFILETGKPENQTITFQITGVEGLPAAAEVGQSYDVQVTGDLTMHGITNPVTFHGQVKAASEDEIQGTLTATVPRDDFSLTIPNVPFVANVDADVVLQLSFVATAG